jgi:hypothetical protein
MNECIVGECTELPVFPAAGLGKVVEGATGCGDGQSVDPVVLTVGDVATVDRDPLLSGLETPSGRQVDSSREQVAQAVDECSALVGHDHGFGIVSALAGGAGGVGRQPLSSDVLERAGGNTGHHVYAVPQTACELPTDEASDVGSWHAKNFSLGGGEHAPLALGERGHRLHGI